MAERNYDVWEQGEQLKASEHYSLNFCKTPRSKNLKKKRDFETQQKRFRYRTQNFPKPTTFEVPFFAPWYGMSSQPHIEMLSKMNLETAYE